MALTAQQREARILTRTEPAVTLGLPVQSECADPLVECRTPDKIQSATGSVRFHHLDALRGILMMWGILVHTSTLGFSPFFKAAAQVSGWVRMDAFFIISGFLAYMLAEKYGARATAVKRVVSIGIPLVTCLVLLNPVTNYLIYAYHNGFMPFWEYLRTGGGDQSARGPMVWSLHLWFLAVLLFYGIATPLLKPAVDRASDFVQRFRTLSDSLLFTATCAFVPVACLAARSFYEFALESSVPKLFLFIGRSTMAYLPYFLLGMFMFRSPRLLSAFSKPHPIHLVLSGAAMYFATIYFDHLPKLAAESVRLLAGSYLAITLSSLLFWAFGKLFPSKNVVSRYLSDAAYTVYLFHFVVIYLVALPLRSWLGTGEHLFWVVALLTFVITVSIHQFLVLRFPILRALFNGKFKSFKPTRLDSPASVR